MIMIKRLVVLASCLLGFCFAAQAETDVPPELGGFFIIDVAPLGLRPASNATDAIWQLFRDEQTTKRKSLSIRTKYNLGTAVVDVKLEGVSDPGIQSIFYRAVVENGSLGWQVTHLGRRHRCGSFGIGIVPIWTTLPCP